MARHSLYSVLKHQIRKNAPRDYVIVRNSIISYFKKILLFNFLISVALSSVDGINSCPPNPDSTLMIKTKSILSRYGNNSDTLVLGLIDSPTL